MKNLLTYEELSPEMKYMLLLRRLRNVAYYCLIDTRPRAQYIHSFRGIRSDIHKLLPLIPPVTAGGWSEVLVEILRIIPPKIKTEHCRQVALNVGEYLESKFNVGLYE